jgi:hypothetical protein
MKIAEKKMWLARLKARAKFLSPVTAEKANAFLEGAERSLSKENEEKLAQMVLRARTDAAVMAELSKLRVISVDNFLVASANALSFFDTVTLGANEIPFIENTSRQEIIVSYIGQDGRARKTQPVRYQEQAQVQLRVISTEEYEYKIKDILRGNVADSSKANIDMTYDMTMKVNKLAWPYIKGLIGNFTTGGAKQHNVYALHSSINANNIPTTNLLYPTDVTDPSSQSTTSLFGKTCMDAILIYCAAWGVDAFRWTGMTGALKPVAVYIPSSEIMGFLSQITLTSFPNEVVQDIMENGFPMHYAGVDWLFVPDATLDPKAGLAYVRTNRSIGTYFTKPSFDEVFEDTSIDMRKQNLGSVSMNKAIGWGIPNISAAFTCAVQYHKARS